MKNLSREEVDSFLKNLRRGDEVEVNILEAGEFSHATVGAHRGKVDWKSSTPADAIHPSDREVSIICPTGIAYPNGVKRISIRSHTKVAYLGKTTKAGTKVEAGS